MFGFYDGVRKKATSIWEKIHHHPFIVEMSEGRLPIEKFKFYLIQDHFFLEEFCRFLAIALAKSQTIEQLRWFGYHINLTLNDEMEMQKRLLEFLGVSEQAFLSTKPTPTLCAYTSYLIRVASLGSLGEVIAAMSPCPCSYLELAERLISSGGIEKHFVFKEWCSFYASEETKKTVNHLIAVLNKKAEKASNEQKALMQEYFIISSKYEYLFWDMAYKMESDLI